MPRAPDQTWRAEETPVGSRRDFLRAGLLVGGAALMPRWARADGGSDLPRSPSLRPFAQELPQPPAVQPVAPFSTARPVPPGAVFNELHIREGLHRYHPDLPPATV